MYASLYITILYRRLHYTLLYCTVGFTIHDCTTICPSIFLLFHTSAYFFLLLFILVYLLWSVTYSYIFYDYSLCKNGVHNITYANSGVQYSTAHCRSSLGLCPCKLLQAKGYIWPYIPPLVLIRIQFILTRVTIETFSIKIPVLSFLESNIGRVDSLYFSGSWRYIFQYIPSSTESVLENIPPALLRVHFSVHSKQSWTYTGKCYLVDVHYWATQYRPVQYRAARCTTVQYCVFLCSRVQYFSA